MEYDNDENTWRRPSHKTERVKCYSIPRKSTTMAVIVLGLAVLSCLLGYCVLSESLPYESKTLRLVVIVRILQLTIITIYRIIFLNVNIIIFHVDFLHSHILILISY